MHDEGTLKILFDAIPPTAQSTFIEFLMGAAGNNRMDIVTMLLKDYGMRADVYNSSALCEAAQRGHWTIATALLDDQRHPADPACYSGFVLLQATAQASSKGCCCYRNMV